MKYHILQVFETSIEFIKKSSDHFKDIYKLKLLTSFDVNMTSFLKGVPNYVLTLLPMAFSAFFNYRGGFLACTPQNTVRIV